jgi:hypothetical protein
MLCDDERQKGRNGKISQLNYKSATYSSACNLSINVNDACTFLSIYNNVYQVIVEASFNCNVYDIFCCQYKDTSLERNGCTA